MASSHDGTCPRDLLQGLVTGTTCSPFMCADLIMAKLTYQVLNNQQDFNIMDWQTLFILILRWPPLRFSKCQLLTFLFRTTLTTCSTITSATQLINYFCLIINFVKRMHKLTLLAVACWLIYLLASLFTTLLQGCSQRKFMTEAFHGWVLFLGIKSFFMTTMLYK